MRPIAIPYAPWVAVLLVVCAAGGCSGCMKLAAKIGGHTDRSTARCIGTDGSASQAAVVRVAEQAIDDQVQSGIVGAVMWIAGIGLTTGTGGTGLVLIARAIAKGRKGRTTCRH